MNEKLDHYGTHAFSLIKQHFNRPSKIIRIATGYFTFEGWNLLRKIINPTEVRILIGFDHQAPVLIRSKLVDKIMEDLASWHDSERREAITQIVKTIKQGGFYLLKHDNDTQMDLRSRQKDHSKVYILDDFIVLAGSVNLTYSGLIQNQENLTAVENIERIEIYIQTFESNWYSDDTFDVTQDLLERLEKWLLFVDPFDIYLKTIDTLKSTANTERVKPSYKRPAQYQLDVISQMERQLQHYKGCMLIASTGLGKTVMATDTALRLRNKGLVENVIVFAPRATHKDWETHLDSAKLRHKVFTRNLLDYSEQQSQHKLNEMLIELDDADGHTLIILDESHYFANRYKQVRNNKKSTKREEKLSYRRIQDVIQNKKSFIVLMTATPLVKKASDINNQLSFLPHSSLPNLQNKQGQYRLLFNEDADDTANQWFIPEINNYFDSFVHLPISTIITTSYVAKNYCIQTDDGYYLEFPDKVRYLPQFKEYKIRYQPPYESEMSKIFADKVLIHGTFHFIDRDLSYHRSQATVEQRTLQAWASSPEALIFQFERIINGEFDKIPFLSTELDRKNSLYPIIKRLRNLNFEQNDKLKSLIDLLDAAILAGRKVIIFAELLPTAVYLEKQLRKLRRNFKVACTIRYHDKERTYKQKPKRKAEEILYHFASVANEDKIYKNAKIQPYDILITTDAYGVGINLQDASVVINYDLAWTPDVIIQRVGRVLRFWEDPRKIEVYTFLPFIEQESYNAIKRIDKRTRLLIERASQAMRFSELPLLIDSEENDSVNLGDWSKITVEPSPLTPDTIEPLVQVSPMLDRHAELRKYRERANNLNDDLISALEKDNFSETLLYMLIQVNKIAYLILYNPELNQFIKKREDDILNIIYARPEQNSALFNSNTIESYASKCVSLWCQEKDIDEENVQRICTMLIVPRGKSDLMGNMK